MGPGMHLGISGGSSQASQAVSSQDAVARAGALPLTGSRRFPLLPRVDVPRRDSTSDESLEAVKQLSS